MQHHLIVPAQLKWQSGSALDSLHIVKAEICKQAQSSIRSRLHALVVHDAAIEADHVDGHLVETQHLAAVFLDEGVSVLVTGE